MPLLTIPSSQPNALTHPSRAVEEKYSQNDLGPFSNFEWGIINGKVSTLRWVFGDEWDVLDT